MLRFPYGFTENEEVDRFLRGFVNNALKDSLREIIYDTEYCEKRGYGSGNLLDGFFPENWIEIPDRKHIQLRIMKGLYSLLNSEREYVPILIMEYVLSRVIEMEIDFVYDDDGEVSSEYSICFDDDDRRDKEVNVPFTEQTRNKIKNAYIDVYLECPLEKLSDYVEDEAERQGLKEEAEERAEEQVESLWHYSPEWFEFCFWDCDYELLNMMSPGEIRNSFVNIAARVMSDDASDEEFYLPDDWENSKDFHYLKEDNEEDDESDLED